MAVFDDGDGFDSSVFDARLLAYGCYRRKGSGLDVVSRICSLSITSRGRGGKRAYHFHSKRDQVLDSCVCVRDKQIEGSTVLVSDLFWNDQTLQESESRSCVVRQCVDCVRLYSMFNPTITFALIDGDLRALFLSFRCTTIHEAFLRLFGSRLKKVARNLVEIPPYYIGDVVVEGSICLANANDSLGEMTDLQLVVIEERLLSRSIVHRAIDAVYTSQFSGHESWRRWLRSNVFRMSPHELGRPPIPCPFFALKISGFSFSLSDLRKGVLPATAVPEMEGVFEYVAHVLEVANAVPEAVKMDALRLMREHEIHAKWPTDWAFWKNMNPMKLSAMSTSTGSEVFEEGQRSRGGKRLDSANLEGSSCGHASEQDSASLRLDTSQVLAARQSRLSGVSNSEGSQKRLDALISDYHSSSGRRVSEISVLSLPGPPQESLTIDMEILRSLRIVGQSTDLSVIFAVSERNSWLFGFDQHGVSERIRLEYLGKRLLPGEDGPIQRVNLEAVRTEVSLEDALLLLKYRGECADWGFEYTVSNSNVVMISTVPRIFGRSFDLRDCLRFCKELEVNDSEFVQRPREETGSQAVQKVIPQFVAELCRTKACTGAVKVGDSLTLSQCEAMLNQLLTCTNPFACAHGRPIICAICEMSSLTEMKSSFGEMGQKSHP